MEIETLIFGLVGQISPWWMYVVIMLILTHITIMSVTLFLHRKSTHRSVDFVEIINRFFRFWLWLTTGMKTKEWVAVHTKHHVTCETVDDPHSPQHYGIWKLLTGGVGLYKAAVKQEGAMAYAEGKYGVDLPDDWVEHNIYSKYPALGLVILAFAQTLFLGLPGLAIFIFQAFWIPVLAAGVINGFGHYWGYRNFETPDASRNLFPWGILIGGEELHNNHHAYQNSPKLSQKWWEFDIGWMYICILQFFGLATVLKRNAPPTLAPVSLPDKQPLGREELLSLIHRYAYYIGDRFNKVPWYGGNDDEIDDLIDYFHELLEGNKKTTAFELEKWLSEATHYGHEELKEFAWWLRYLHEADEVSVQK